MTFHLLDVVNPRIGELAAEIESHAKQLKALEIKEEELQQRQNLLNEIDESVWKKVEKKAAKKAKKQARADAAENKENTVNLAQRTNDSSEEVTVNTAGMAGTGNSHDSSIGTVLLLGAALLLCATTAIFYRKKNG